MLLDYQSHSNTAMISSSIFQIITGFLRALNQIVLNFIPQRLLVHVQQRANYTRCIRPGRGAITKSLSPKKGFFNRMGDNYVVFPVFFQSSRTRDCIFSLVSASRAPSGSSISINSGSLTNNVPTPPVVAYHQTTGKSVFHQNLKSTILSHFSTSSWDSSDRNTSYATRSQRFLKLSTIQKGHPAENHSSFCTRRLYYLLAQ